MPRYETDEQIRAGFEALFRRIYGKRPSALELSAFRKYYSKPFKGQVFEDAARVRRKKASTRKDVTNFIIE